MIRKLKGLVVFTVLVSAGLCVAAAQAKECLENFFRVQIYDGTQLTGTLLKEYCARVPSGGSTKIERDWDRNSIRICRANCPGKEDKADRGDQAKSPVYEKRDDRFSVRWSGRTEFEEGRYRFFGESDDGLRIVLDGGTVVDDWSVHARRSFHVEKEISAGWHMVVVEYFENTGGAVTKVGWERIVE
jgi:hypothetical protein